MLTDADRAIWRQFFALMEQQRAQLQAEDMVPVALVLAKVQRRHDDGAFVSTDPADVTLCAMADTRTGRARAGAAFDQYRGLLRRVLTSALATLETT